MDAYLLGESLAHDLISLGVGKEGCPVVFVGYDLGCLILREVCRHAFYQCARKNNEWEFQNLLYSIKGLFYYAPPNHGSVWADKSLNQVDGPLIPELIPLSSTRARSDEEFQHVLRKYEWKTCTVAETCETITEDFQGVVVPEASARGAGDRFLSVQEDHNNVCHPVDQKSDNYQSLVTFVQDLMRKANPVHDDFFSLELSGTVGLRMEVSRHAKLLLDDNSEAHIRYLGLTGMGGIGKTTLAKAIYNEIFREFKFTCFLEDATKQCQVGTNARSHSKERVLQRKILDGMYRKGRHTTDVYGPGEIDWTYLQMQRVLIVLDNVESIDHILRLDETNQFAKGSCVLVTSRNGGILRAASKKYNLLMQVHEVQTLGLEDSQKLLCRYAFKKDRIPLGFTFRETCEKIVSKCGGLPLALEVVGAYLHDEQDMWTEALTRLEKAESLDWDGNDRLWAVLRISYDKLGRVEKEMFKDLATCFAGEDEEEVIAAWRGLYPGLADSGWRKLRNWSLAKVSNAGDSEHRVIFMHEQLKNFGRSELESSDEMHVRLFDAKSLINLLRSQAKTKTKIVKLDNWDGGSRFDMRRVAEFLELKVLWLKGVPLSGVCHKIDTHLVSLKCSGSQSDWVQVDHGEKTFVPEHHELPPIAEIPSLIHLNLKLVTRSFAEHRTESTYGINQHESRRAYESSPNFIKEPFTFERMGELKHLVIDGFRVRKVMEKFWGFQNVEYMIISNSPTMQLLGSSLGNMCDHDLRQLRIFRCSRLEELPATFGDLSNLTQLTMFQCPNFKKFPASFTNLSSLQTLHLVNLDRLSHLPSNMGSLKRLQVLRIVGCSSLRILPSSITDLSDVRSVTLESCSLKYLPPLGRLSGLRNLQLKRLQELEELPMSLGDLKFLECVNIAHCFKLKCLPSSFASLSGLKDLKLKMLPLLESIPVSSEGFPGLTKLAVSRCNNLRGFSCFFNQCVLLQNVTLSKLPLVSSHEVPSVFNVDGQDLEVVRTTVDSLERPRIASISSPEQRSERPRTAPIGEMVDRRKEMVDGEMADWRKVDQMRTDRMKTNQTKPDQTKPEQTKPDQTKEGWADWARRMFQGMGQMDESRWRTAEFLWRMDQINESRRRTNQMNESRRGIDPMNEIHRSMAQQRLINEISLDRSHSRMMNSIRR